MLGAPPAFVLSQDQTLNLIILKLLYRSNKLFSEQLWRFVQIALLLWITCLDFQKKSGFSFIRIYCLIFKFLCEISLTSFLLITQFGSCCLSWQLCYYIMPFPFCQEVFWSFLKKFFWGSFRLLNKLFIEPHKLFSIGLCIDTIFKLLDRRSTRFWTRVSRDSLSIIPPWARFVNDFLRIWRDG